MSAQEHNSNTNTIPLSGAVESVAANAVDTTYSTLERPTSWNSVGNGEDGVIPKIQCNSC